MIAHPQTEEQIENAIIKRQEEAQAMHCAAPPSLPQTPVEGDDPIINSIVEEMNKTFAVLLQPTFLILEENEDGTFSLDKRQSFKERFENQLISLPSGKNKTRAELFLKSPKRRTFRKIVLDPSCVGHYQQNGHWNYNLWQGFAFAPKAGDCEKFKRHILEVVCAGCRDHFEFLLDLLAHWVQKPHVRTVAILLLGPQGCGKNIFAEAVGKLYGRAFGVYDDVERLLGRFNAELAGKIVILADEAFWGGRKSDSGKLKAAITGESVWIESKGKDKIELPNYRKFIAVSNERFAIPLDRDDRRWLVLNCSSSKVGNDKHFNAIVEELEHGGYEALLSELLHRDITKFNPRRLPVNDDAFDLKLQCAESFIKYLYASACDGRADLNTSNGFLWTEDGLTIRTDVLRDKYHDFCRKEKLSPQSEKECGWALKNLFVGTNFTRKRKRFESGERHLVYHFPALSKCKEKLASYFRVSELNSMFPIDEEEEND